MTDQQGADQGAGTSTVGAFGRLKGVDSVRALAILLVFGYHSWEFAAAPTAVVKMGTLHLDFLRALSQGFWGVQIFMVVSGFVLFLPVSRHPPGQDRWNLRNYGIGRFRRIVPPYYVAIAVLILGPEALVGLARLSGHHANWVPLPSWWDLVTHLTFTHTLFPSTWTSIEGSFWSLGLEAQFYLAFPFLVALYRRAGAWTLVFVVVSSLLYRTVFDNLLSGAPFTTTFLVSITFLGRWIEFGTGMAAALVVARYRSQGITLSHATTTAIALAGVLFIVLVFFVVPGDFHVVPLQDVLVSLAAFCLIATGAIGSGFPRGLLESRALVAVGVVSYSLFLIHQNALYYLSEGARRVGHLGASARLLFLVTLGFGLMLAMSFLMFRLIEMPFMRKPTARLVRQELRGPS